MSKTQEKIDAIVAQRAKAREEILAQIAEFQAEIDAGVQVDLSVLTAAVQGLDDLNPDDAAEEPEAAAE